MRFLFLVKYMIHVHSYWNQTKFPIHKKYGGEERAHKLGKGSYPCVKNIV